MEKLNSITKEIMDERFGKDNIIALATVKNGEPYVRNVDGFYQDGAFYVITYALSNKMKQIEENVKNSAYEIISKKHATYYGIAMSVKRVCECIVRNEKSILPISSIMNGEYGIDEIALSMPAIVGIDGIETHVPISLNDEETKSLKHSAETLKKIICGLDL